MTQYAKSINWGGGGSGGSSTFTGLTDTPSSFSGQGAKVVSVNVAENALEFTTPTGTDELTKVSLNDTTAGYLEDKIVSANSAITIATLNDGLDEDLQLTFDETAITITESQISDLGSYLTTVALNDISDVTITTVTNDEILQYTGAGWENQTLAEAGIQAALGFTPANSTVTLTAGEGLSGGGDLSTNRSFALDINGLTNASTTLGGSDLFAFYDATTDTRVEKITWSNLQGQISITESQISDLGSYITDISGSPLSQLSDTTITGIGAGEILKWSGSAWINNTLAEAGIAAASHTHTESDITDLQSYLLNVVEDTTPQLGGSLDVNGNSIVSTSAGNITITPDTTGSIVLDGLSWPQADGTADYVLKTNGAGQLSWTANTGGLGNVVEDTTPQLGGSLDVNGNSIVSTSAGNITITPDTTGSIVLDGLSWPQADGTADYVLKTNGAGQLSWTAQTGGTTTWTGLTDTPGSFTANTIYGANAGATALEAKPITSTSSQVTITDADLVLTKTTNLEQLRVFVDGQGLVVHRDMSSIADPVYRLVGGATGTASDTSDRIGTLEFYGGTGSAHAQGAEIEVAPASTWTHATDYSTNMTFRVVQDSSTALTDYLSLHGQAGATVQGVHLGTAGTNIPLFTHGDTSGYIKIVAPSTITSYTLTLPDSAGTNGYVLQTNGSGTTSWVAQAAGSGDVVGPASSTDNALAIFDSTTGKLLKEDSNILANTDGGHLTAGNFTGTHSITTYDTGIRGDELAGANNTIGVMGTVYTDASTASGKYLYGGVFWTQDDATRTATITQLNGLYGSSASKGSGAVTSVNGLYYIASNNGTGTVTDCNVLNLATGTNAGTRNSTNHRFIYCRNGGWNHTGGTVSNLYGLHLENQVGSGTISTRYAIYEDWGSDGATNYWTSPHQSGLGSTSAPTYSFNSDTNTGMWSSAADTLNFSTGGTERLEIDGTSMDVAVPTNIQAGGLTYYSAYNATLDVQREVANASNSAGLKVVSGRTSAGTGINFGALITAEDHTSRGAASYNVGIFGEAFQKSSNTLTYCEGLRFATYIHGAGTVTQANGANITIATNTGTRTVTNANYLYLRNGGLAHTGGAITNLRGLYLEATTGSGTVTNRYGVYEDWGGNGATNYWTSPHQSGLGSTSAPTYSFNSDTNTGMWASAADTLNFSTGGTERLEIDGTSIDATVPLITSDTTESTSGSTGSIITSGGIGAAKNIVSGGALWSVHNDKGNSGTTMTITWTDSNVQTVTLNGNCTFTFAGAYAGMAVNLILKQDATGSRTVTWPTISWVGGSAPTLSTAASSVDIIGFLYDGTTWYGGV